MQTDRFDETIRQKLDSLQPAYHESAWRTLHQTLLQHGIVSTGTAIGGLLSTLTALTVAGLIGTTVYLYRSNGELRQQVGTLTRTVARLEQQRLTAPNPTTGSHRIDTVYMNRPASREPVSTVNPSSSDKPDETNSEKTNIGKPGVTQSTVRQITGGQTSTQPVATADPVTARKPAYRQPAAPANPATNRVPAPAPTNEGVTSTGSPANEPITRQSSVKAVREPGVAGNQSTARPVREPDIAISQPGATDPTQPAGASSALPPVGANSGAGTEAVRVGQTNTRQPAGLPAASASGTAGRRSKQANRTATDQPALATSRNSAATRRSRRDGAVPGDPVLPVTPADQRNPSGESMAQPRSVGMLMTELANRPLQLTTMETSAGIARRVRRLRYLFPSDTPPVVPASPVAAAGAARPDSKRVSVASTVRLGVSGEADGLRIGGGLYAETRLGTHWTLGLGLNRLSQSGGTYQTDDDFDQSTRSDFRRDYIPPGFDPRFDPKSDITNISVSRQSWQLPLSVGYRVPLNHGFALTPTVGLALALSVNEHMTFIFQRGPRDVGSGTVNALVLPVNWYNNASLSLAAEKSWGHFTVQAVPFVSFPTATLPNRLSNSPYRPNAATGGIRLRLLYSF